MEFFPNMRIFSIQRIDIFIFSFLHSLTMLSYLNNNIFSRSEQTTTAFTVSDLLRENPQVGKINPPAHPPRLGLNLGLLKMGLASVV